MGGGKVTVVTYKAKGKRVTARPLMDTTEQFERSNSHATTDDLLSSLHVPGPVLSIPHAFPQPTSSGAT